MSSEVGIRASGLGKRFKLHANPWRHLAARLVRAEGGRDVWALREIDLDLKPGDALAIIGRNGAGKSTLLEIICGIRRPDEGEVRINGRIAALLQLGAGFNPEFTGRENVMLAASVYGLSDSEIARRMDEIVAFAGIGDFLDRPMREYSTGMFARLAFSVCAHVDADILAVDEILGVGDVRFQQRSMRFLREFRRKGIVLFVSHDENAVAALCDKAIWIDRGSIVAAGSSRSVLNAYRREMSRLMMPVGGFTAEGDYAELDEPAFSDEEGEAFDPHDLPPADGAGRIDRVEVRRADGGRIDSAEGGEDIAVEIGCRAEMWLRAPRLVFVLRDHLGQLVFAGDSAAGEEHPAGLAPGDRFDCAFRFRLPFLPTGSYPVEAYLLSDDAGRVACHDRSELAAVISVLSRHVSSGMANVTMRRTRLMVGSA